MDKLDHRYDIETQALYEPLQRIDVGALAAAQTPWWNRTLCAVNDAVVRLAVIEGEFHWHKHDAEDEFFYVVSGHLDLDLEGRTIGLEPNEGFTVPRGVLHRTRAPTRTVILMVEKAGVVPTGDQGAAWVFISAHPRESGDPGFSVAMESAAKSSQAQARKHKTPGLCRLFGTGRLRDIAGE